jgi:molecular chaperone DnaK
MLLQVSLLQEPVAAAMAFGFGKPHDAETLLVFDLGGGTFDLSVVDTFEGIMEVLATGGDAFLGGDDFDSTILQGVLEQQLDTRQHQHSHSGDSGSSGSSAASINSLEPDVLAELLAAAESAKCQLSTQEAVQLPISAAAAVQLGGKQHPQQQQQDGSITLTRQRMHDLTAGLRQRLWQPLQSLADACKLQYACTPSSVEQRLQGQQPAAAADSSGNNGIHADPYAPKPRQLTAVLLVGGATRMPIVQQGLQVLTGLQPR